MPILKSQRTQGNQALDLREIHYSIIFLQQTNKNTNFLDNPYLGRALRICLLWAGLWVHTSMNLENKMRRGGMDKKMGNARENFPYSGKRVRKPENYSHVLFPFPLF